MRRLTTAGQAVSVDGLILVAIGVAMIAWSRFAWTQIRLPDQSAELTLRTQWLRSAYGSRRIGAIGVGLLGGFFVLGGLTKIFGG